MLCAAKVSSVLKEPIFSQRKVIRNLLFLCLCFHCNPDMKTPAGLGNIKRGGGEILEGVMDQLLMVKGAFLQHQYHLGVGCSSTPSGLDVLPGCGSQVEAHNEGAVADVQSLLCDCSGMPSLSFLPYNAASAHQLNTGAGREDTVSTVMSEADSQRVGSLFSKRSWLTLPNHQCGGNAKQTLIFNTSRHPVLPPLRFMPTPR